MLVDRSKRAQRPTSMVLSNYGHLRTHTDLDGGSGTGSPRGSPAQTPTTEIKPAPGEKPEMCPNSEEPETEDTTSTLRKGLVWCCKDTLLSRWNWKERYFILTKDYLSCFKKAKSQYSDMGAFLFKLPLASLSGVEWDRLRGSATVAIIDPKEGRLLIRSTQDVLDQWYRILKKATEASKERRRCLRMSSSNLSTLSSGPGTPRQLRSSALSDSSPAIDRLCEKIEREVWGGGGSGRLMRRQKSELDAGVLLRRQLHYASQKRYRHSMMPSDDIIYTSGPKQKPDITLDVHRRQNDSLDSTGHSPSTTPSKSSMSSSEGVEMRRRRPTSASRTSSGGTSGSSHSSATTPDCAEPHTRPRGTPAKVAEGAVTVDVITGEVRPRRTPTRGPASLAESRDRAERERVEREAGAASVVMRSSSVRRRARGRTPLGVHGDQIRPHSILCDTPSDPSEVVLRRKDRNTTQQRMTQAQNRRSCDLSLLKRRSAYLTQYEH